MRLTEQSHTYICTECPPKPLSKTFHDFTKAIAFAQGHLQVHGHTGRIITEATVVIARIRTEAFTCPFYHTLPYDTGHPYQLPGLEKVSGAVGARPEAEQDKTYSSHISDFSENHSDKTKKRGLMDL